MKYKVFFENMWSYDQLFWCYPRKKKYNFGASFIILLKESTCGRI